MVFLRSAGLSGKGEERKSVALSGKTLQVYLYLLRRREAVGVREVQRGLRLSSPSVAFHHLEKLRSLGVVEKDQSGQYKAVKNVDVDVLQAFINIGGIILPRMLFYASFFTTFTALYVASNIHGINPYALLIGTLASAVFWYETVKAWMKKPW